MEKANYEGMDMSRRHFVRGASSATVLVGLAGPAILLEGCASGKLPDKTPIRIDDLAQVYYALREPGSVDYNVIKDFKQVNPEFKPSSVGEAFRGPSSGIYLPVQEALFLDDIARTGSNFNRDPYLSETELLHYVISVLGTRATEGMKDPIIDLFYGNPAPKVASLVVPNPGLIIDTGIYLSSERDRIGLGKAIEDYTAQNPDSDLAKLLKSMKAANEQAGGDSGGSGGSGGGSGGSGGGSGGSGGGSGGGEGGGR